MDNFDTATRRVQRCARQLIADGTPPTIIADALITQALAAWQADTGRATRGPQPVALTVRVDGATGNEEVRRMVAQGVSQGIGQYDKQVDRTFGARMAKAQMRQL